MIKSFIFNFFSYLGISITRLTKKDKIIQFIKALHLIQTEHNLQDIWNSKFFPTANTVFNKILKNHHCVCIHPNNCSGIDSGLGVQIPRTVEFTFLRKNRAKKIEYQKSFPHPLDFDNVYG